jgi:hypothetical protein
MSFGPRFGHEAAVATVEALKGLGLEYAEDFFMLETDIPDWCQLGISLRPSAS